MPITKADILANPGRVFHDTLHKRWRPNGQCKTWKRSPERFRLPVKFGLYSYDAITEHNVDGMHWADECDKD